MLISIPECSVEQELVFKEVNGQPLKITFLPPTRKVFEKAPVFVVICGGGWHTQNREVVLDMYKISSALLREVGVCIVSADYRVTSVFPDTNAGEEIGDVIDAIAYISQYAEILEIDTQRIVLTGHSAGGHIISMIAYAPSELFPTVYATPEVKYVGCVTFATPFILYSAELFDNENLKECIKLFPNDTFDEKVAHRWSPYNYISKQNPATLIIHGDSDALVPVEQAIQSMQKAREVGADFAMICPQNGGHGLEPMDEKKTVEPSYEAVQQHIAEWVCDRLGIRI